MSVLDARAILEAAARAAQQALPLRWQRGTAQKDYELADCAPVARAALLAALPLLRDRLYCDTDAHELDILRAELEALP